MKPKLTIYTSGPEIVVHNSDTQPLHIIALELEYEVTTRSLEPTLPYEEESVVAPVRVLHEREKLDIVLKPGEQYKYYFGAVEKLKSVTCVVMINDQELRVTHRLAREEE